MTRTDRQCENGSYGTNKRALINLQISSLDVSRKGEKNFSGNFSLRRNTKRWRDEISTDGNRLFPVLLTHTHSVIFTHTLIYTKACEGQHVQISLLMAGGEKPPSKS